MKKLMIEMFGDVFLKHYVLQQALKSQDRLVANEAVLMLSELTGLRRVLSLETQRKFLKFDSEKRRLI